MMTPAHDRDSFTFWAPSMRFRGFLVVRRNHTANLVPRAKKAPRVLCHRCYAMYVGTIFGKVSSRLRAAVVISSLALLLIVCARLPWPWAPCGLDMFMRAWLKGWASINWPVPDH